ncbi:hypothetical protein C8J56DRAFT_764389, partial [Mycena floridula]
VLEPDSSAPLTAYDGKVGAVLDSGRYFITSPTSDHIPDPQITGIQVRLRLDHRFGPDDFILYPQVYLPDRIHHSVIRARPDNSQSRDAIFWWQ